MFIKHDAAIWLEQYFEKLRLSKEWHLGLGDVRLSLGQQEQIVDIVNTMCKFGKSIVEEEAE